MPQCSLHSRKSKETRGVKTFPTKTRRDVGMVPHVSKEHVSLHGKTNWWKNSRNKKGSPTEVNILQHPGTRRGTILCSITQVNILRHHISKTLWICHHLRPIPPSKFLQLAVSPVLMSSSSKSTILLRHYNIQVPISGKDPSSLIMLQHPIQYQFYHLYTTHVKLICCYIETKANTLCPKDHNTNLRGFEVSSNIDVTYVFPNGRFKLQSGYTP